MHTFCIQKYLILYNALATLSPHLPQHQNQQDRQTATMIVSATSMKTTATTTHATTTVTTRDFARATTAPATTRTASASTFVDEVLPHNDSVATTKLHAKAIDSSSMMNNKNNNSTNDFQQLLERKLQKEAKNDGIAAPPDRLLSRKRRYLIFPEGSSFQLVYDGIYGIVDYTNYLILGITVALAWELPSKPQGEVIEEIANRLRDGRLEVRRNDTATDIIYVDTKKNQPDATKQHALQAVKSLQPNYIDVMTGTNPAAKKSDYKNYYTNAGRLPAAFHAPMHQKYYYYKGSNKYDSNNYGKYSLWQRPADSYYRQQMASPIGGYYKERPNDWRRKDNHYYRGSNKSNKGNKNKNINKSYKLSSLKVNPFSKWAPKPQRPSSVYGYKTPQAMQGGYGQYPWWNLPARLSNSLRRKPIPSRRTDSSSTSQPVQQQRLKQQQQPARQQQKGSASGFYRQSPATARKHRIYPVFGKRSIAYEPPTAMSAATHNNSSSSTNHAQQQSTPHHRHRRSGIVGPDLSRMERIHIRHHRSTRQALYEKIEKYLDKLEIKNSHQCILRALCETGQKSKERGPGTFVGEIMRAVFTIPEALDQDLLYNRIHYKDQRYDRANAFEGSCDKEYALCQQSLWETQFVK
ncbi:uncharacterized protein LOC128868658 [Anastrepha ludens]|uniref:uncharacterized protein LOC128868658 n=1 Tax=Anastrepha ludens TaxID=28586 RepID=UPI0023AF00B1|nr:uncharacterized protein LOC128868658 [Anastrepha ludens]